MASNRRPRGSLVDPRKIGLTVEKRSDERLTSAAAAARTTRAALAQWLIDRMAVDEHGVPVGWWDDHQRPNELELPIAV